MLRKVKDAEDVATIKSALDALQQSVIKIGEAMYKAQSASAQGSGGPSTGSEQSAGQSAEDKKDEPISGQYEEVKK
jgi:molecular chaperone DnaK